MMLDEADKKQIQLLGDYMKQINDEKELENQERKKLLEASDEQKDLIKQLIDKGYDKTEIYQYVDDKIGHSDELNRQILKEIYEDQMN